MKEPGLGHLSPKSQSSLLSPLPPLLCRPQLPQPSCPSDFSWEHSFYSVYSDSSFQCPSSFKAQCNPPTPWNHSWQPQPSASLGPLASWSLCSIHGSLNPGCCVLMCVSHEHILLLATSPSGLQELCSLVANMTMPWCVFLLDFHSGSYRLPLLFTSLLFCFVIGLPSSIS